MSLSEAVKKMLDENVELQVPEADEELDEALREAERLADEFSDVQVVPYLIPVERFIGMKYRVEEKQRPLVSSRAFG